ncbi:hypothetical protein APY94_02915 [Thermococcus celericrescens]|uniref:Uncharacterized protein n=1 Tax=Thermococcus celericrescens TaxID=227598 RepID=A0A100XYY1_9EURY|nr:hypothetical protein [Thermococcus celericrescens]KUH34241.1 hypothetical protein APY94_02915 [Thermococcus celericrescens]
MTEWVVIRYKFNEITKCWEYDGVTILGSDELLLEYLRSQAHVGSVLHYRYEITAMLRPERRDTE